MHNKINKLKSDIILEGGLKYYDFTASSLGVKSILNHIYNLLPNYANTHSQTGSSAQITQFHYQNARISAKKSLELDDNFALIACGYGSSAAIKKFQEIMGIYCPPELKKHLKQIPKNELPLVIVGAYEHHSNELSFMNGVCECKRISLDINGQIDYNSIVKILKREAKSRLKILSFSAASNVTGIYTNINRLNEIAKQFNAILALDCSTIAPYENIPCNFYDAMFISGHKILGGVGGCGLLAIRKNLLKKEPTFAAGGTVEYVSRQKAFYIKDVEMLEEGGTPGILQFIITAKALELRNNFGLENIKKIEQQNVFYAFSCFAKLKLDIDGLVVYAENIRNRLAIFSINILGISPFDLAQKLSDKYGIQTRAGCACAGPYGHELLELEDYEKVEDLKFKPGWLRFNFHYTHTKHDIDYFFECLLNAYNELKTF